MKSISRLRGWEIISCKPLFLHFLAWIFKSPLESNPRSTWGEKSPLEKRVKPIHVFLHMRRICSSLFPKNLLFNPQVCYFANSTINSYFCIFLNLIGIFSPLTSIFIFKLNFRMLLFLYNDYDLGSAIMSCNLIIWLVISYVCG